MRDNNEQTVVLFLIKKIQTPFKNQASLNFTLQPCQFQLVDLHFFYTAGINYKLQLGCCNGGSRTTTKFTRSLRANRVGSVCKANNHRHLQN